MEYEDVEIRIGIIRYETQLSSSKAASLFSVSFTVVNAASDYR
jgi:hypothetical protein